MKSRLLGILLATLALTTPAQAEYRYVGGDISMLPQYQNAGSQYYDPEGKKISFLLPWLHTEGMNAMRVRLFVNPSDYTGSDRDPNACQDLDYIIPICRQIKEAGMDLMLDFHYSDTWADPAKQWTPKVWAGLTDSQLYEKIYDYTRETLLTLQSEGITPDFIQPGNEISYGMLWGTKDTPSSQLKKTFMGSDANWTRLGNLLKNAIKACREVCPKAGIVIHTERVAQVDVQNNFYNRMRSLGIHYDIIGLSYYPYFHGKMSVLDNALSSLEKNFGDKRIMIVETGYPYAWEVPGTDKTVDYDYTVAGQNQFATELVATLLKHQAVDGLFWWWMEYNAKGTSLSGWYNAPLFDSRDGKATPALRTICSFAAGNDTAVDTLQEDPDPEAPWYNLQGVRVDHPLPGNIYIHAGRKVLRRPLR